jgi:salicylate hydroxylase
MPPSKPIHVAVCGGGIAGLCLAIGLIRRNVSCKIYEAAPAFAEIGAGVSFGPNALRAMELIDPEILKGYRGCSTTNGWPEKKTTWFDFRIGQNNWEGEGERAAIGKHVVEVRAGEVGQSSVHRAHFLDALVKLVPADVATFGKRLEAIIEGNDSVIMEFEDGTTAEADVIVGCDGIKSKTRKILLGDSHESANAKFSGKYAYRGLVPMEKAVNALGDELARNSQMYMGHHGHILTFPIEKGKTMNVVAFRTKMDGKWEDDRWVLPMKRENLVEDFQGWGNDVQKILPVSSNFCSTALNILTVD